LSSRLLKKTRYEAANGGALDFEAEFLRWMLSDGAGAFLLQPKPKSRGLSLRIDWIELISWSSDFDLCMSCGTPDQITCKDSWQDYDTYADAEKNGALLIRQNLRILDNIVRVGVEGFLRLIKQGKISPAEIDHFVCHYSSHHFRGKILELFELSGCMIPEEKWFTNLYEKGNTGCASIFIALDELFKSGRLRAGDTVFCSVPESGRFTTAYIRLTAVEGE
jgi:3-oxoacyl-[acyl-carrier-protein] synthase III